jgi:DNA-binding PucR family transcriptional regulator
LNTWFDSGGNQSRSAEALHIHVNTLSQRLGRIDSLIGPDWRNPHRALQLQLAVRLHYLRA